MQENSQQQDDQQQNESQHTWLGIFLRGMAMGAADAVPGVSGGTIALISGIYPRLLDAISSADMQLLDHLKRMDIAKAWQHVDATFLIVLLSGIATSIIALANVMVMLLDRYPLLVWSFFFGLIFASALFLMRQIKQWQLITGVMLVAGVAVAVVITKITPAAPELTPWYLFITGAVSICAMILPGLSGSFLLVLFGVYAPILIAIKEFQLELLVYFALGAGLGLLSFSKLLSWLLLKYRESTMALLTGFLFGSLYLVWPWKNILEWYSTSGGRQKPLVKENVLPQNYLELTGNDAQVFACIGLMLLGVALLMVMAAVADTKPDTRSDSTSDNTSDTSDADASNNTGHSG